MDLDANEGTHTKHKAQSITDNGMCTKGTYKIQRVLAFLLRSLLDAKANRCVVDMLG